MIVTIIRSSYAYRLKRMGIDGSSLDAASQNRCESEMRGYSNGLYKELGVRSIKRRFECNIQQEQRQAGPCESNHICLIQLPRGILREGSIYCCQSTSCCLP